MAPSTTTAEVVVPPASQIADKLKNLTGTQPTSTSTTNTLPGPLSPLSKSSSILQYNHFNNTVVLGTEFPRGSVQLADLLSASNSDELIRDLATLVSERNVVFFRAQRINVEQQKELGRRLGELTGKPQTSKLHVHPSTKEVSELGDEISVISSKERLDGTQAIRKQLENVKYRPNERGSLASDGWHSDITFEPIPSDYALLKIHTLPETGGDTIWASGYEVYDRLSPAFQKFLEGLTAINNADFFRHIATARGRKVRGSENGETRGAPENTGDHLTAVHPVVRTNPVTGWKSVFVNRGFTRRIDGLTKEESDRILDFLNILVKENHDLQVRFKWRKYDDDPEAFDVAIWDNRSSYHTATDDYLSIDGTEVRTGDRVVSLGEKPYYDENSKGRREALGLSKPLLERFY